MTGNQLRQKYLDFFKKRGHVVIPSSPIVPQNDPTTLFTSSGMQPLVPYLLGQTHPEGTRLVDSQKSFRSQDIEEVGDDRHTTMFEMLGNWSLGDYFKKEQLSWFFEFLTSKEEGLGLNPYKLYVTVFSGDPDTGVDRDEESIEIWKKLFSQLGIDARYVELGTEANGYKQGMGNGRIFGYGVKKNWWSRSGIPANMPAGEPGGPDSEVFYNFGLNHNPRFGKFCHPNCDCGRFFEIGNSVFMQYQKLENGSLRELPQKNVDFGGGLERLLAPVHEASDMFQTDMFQPMLRVITEKTDKPYDTNKAGFQIIADHLKGAVFLIDSGIYPGSKAQGYMLKRLIRRSVVKLHKLGLVNSSIIAKPITQTVFKMYETVQYFSNSSVDEVSSIIAEEMIKFERTLTKGLKIFEKTSQITGAVAFNLLQTYGFPWELTFELASEQGQQIIKEDFEVEFKKHQALSRSTSKGMFKGGLADNSEATTKLHTTTHLLHTALRNVLGNHVRQEGSNITAERLRFDFAHPQALTNEEIKIVETEINQKISDNLSVVKTIEDRDTALKSGAIAFFKEKYPDKVSVYTIGDPKDFYSKEFCGGPHVSSTGEIGAVKITKQQSIGAGKRRIYVELSS